MRKLLWIAGLLVLVAAGLVGTAALSLNRIIAQEHDRLLQRAQTALGRDVTADRITLNLWNGFGVRVDNPRVGDDPHFATADFARAATVIVRPKLLPLLRGRLAVRRIDVREPEVQLIRDSSGQWNYATLGRHAASAAHTPEPSAPAPSVPPEQLPFVIAQANVENGTFTIIDRSRQPEETMRVTQVDVRVGDIGAAMPIRFSLDAAVQGDTRNVHLHGRAGPWRAGAAAPLQLDGDLGPLGPDGLRVNDLHLDAALTPTTLQVAQLRGRAWNGSFQLAGQYPLRSGGDEVRLKGEFSQIAVGQLLRLTMRDLSRGAQGSARLTVDLHATGVSADALRASLAGQVVADVQDALLKDFNFVNETLGQLTNLPRIGELVSRKVKPKYGKLFSQRDTHVRRLHTTLNVAEQRMRTDDLTVEGDDFTVRGAGWLAFDRDIDLTGTLAMSKRFTRDVVADVKEARYLMDEHDELAIPFRLRGKLGQAKPQPDTTYLVARLSQAIAPGAVKDLVEKFLGSARQKRPAPPSTPGKADNPLEQRLRDLLGR